MSPGTRYTTGPRDPIPDRVVQARRAAVRFGLMDAGLGRAAADRGCDAWPVDATGPFSLRDAADRHTSQGWIAAQRKARSKLGEAAPGLE